MAKEIYNKNAREAHLMAEAYERVYNEDAEMEFDERGFAKNTPAGREDGNEPDNRNKGDTPWYDVKDEDAEIPSEEFNVENKYGNATTYAIFVGVDSLPHFQKIAQQKGYEGLQFLKITDPDLDEDGNPKEQGVITMPAYESGGASHEPGEIEKELFKHNPPNNGFWGQQGLGYKGKHWTPIG